LNISLGSIAETKSHLYLAFDLDYLDRGTFESIFEKLDEAGRMIFALSSHLRSPQRLPGLPRLSRLHIYVKILR
jgi:23S rRNA-intervening sequence protein